MVNRLLAMVLVILIAAPSLGDVTVPNTFTNGTNADATEVNANFTAVLDGINRDQTFFATEYASGSDSGGIIEAYDACVAADGGTVVLPSGTTAIDGNDFTSVIFNLNDVETCDIIGYGSSIAINPSALYGGTVLHITNTAGLTIFNVEENGNHMAHFGVVLEGVNASTKGIYCNDLNNLSVIDVYMDSSGTTGTGAGIGVDMYRCLKSNIRGSEFHQFSTGLRVDSYSNATSVSDSKFRAGGLGINFTGTDGAVASSFALNDVTIEGNERGILADGTGTWLLAMSNVYFEQNGGTLASRYNMRIDHSGFKFHAVGGFFDGTLPSKSDIIRNAASAFGPDTWIGVRSGSGIDYDTTGAMLHLIDPKYVADSVGGVFAGTDMFHATDCRTAIVNSGSSVFGTTCGETDGDVWQCFDPDNASGTLDGICDHANEVIPIGGKCEISLDLDGGGYTACWSTDGSTSCEVDTNGVCNDAT